MAQLTFYPLGNADTTLIETRDGHRLLIDYADMRVDGDDEDKRCDLPTLLRDDLEKAGVDAYNVVAFTHLDKDHCGGAPDFFYFEHAKQYQDGERVKIETLWVPASAITEEGTEGDGRIIRQEARYRLKQGKGILVFSRPERLEKWLGDNGLSIADRSHCFVDAGKLVPDFSLDKDGVEFFVHSPHALRTNDRGLEDRNGDSLVFQARFSEGGYSTDVLFSADIDHEIIGEIVDITKWHNNDDRLHWNVLHLPHHCSYLSIGPEKGEEKTIPTEKTKWLFEEQGEGFGYIISPSKPIPDPGTKEDQDVQPPHRQAATYYKEEVLTSRNRFLVTMEEPSILSPKPIVIEITKDGAKKTATGSGGAVASVSTVAPRAGR